MNLKSIQIEDARKIINFVEEARRSGLEMNLETLVAYENIERAISIHDVLIKVQN